MLNTNGISIPALKITSAWLNIRTDAGIIWMKENGKKNKSERV